jgi:mono/diheme cytochrome c family protein
MRLAVWLSIVAVALGLSVVTGCGGEPVGEAESPTVLSEAEESEALALYRSEACAVCHGEMGEGIEGAGPVLRDLAPYWDVERLMTYIADPEGFSAANPDFDERRDQTFELEMPASDHLSEEQRRLLARWLLTR